MGLTISSRLVKMMQGEIWVESEPGHGSSFHFTACFGVANLPEPVPPQDYEPWAGMTALIVDDNATNRRILTEQLWQWNLRPASAASGPEALSMLRRGAEHGNPFSLVLTDVHMPEMDGFELAERIKKSHDLAETVILVLTSADHRTDLARCRELGISAYLTKPVRRAELRAAIGAALGGRDANQDDR